MTSTRGHDDGRHKRAWSQKSRGFEDSIGRGCLGGWQEILDGRRALIEELHIRGQEAKGGHDDLNRMFYVVVVH